MYLTKDLYIGADYEHNNVKGTIYITKGGEEIHVDFNSVTTITENAAY